MTVPIADINAVLREEDVEGFIAQGAPGDEYDSEAQEIASALALLNEGQITEANVAAIVALVWAKSFDRSSQEIEMRMSVFRRIAQRLNTFIAHVI